MLQDSRAVGRLLNLLPELQAPPLRQGGHQILDACGGKSPLGGGRQQIRPTLLALSQPFDDRLLAIAKFVHSGRVGGGEHVPLFREDRQQIFLDRGKQPEQVRQLLFPVDFHAYSFVREDPG